MSSENHKIDSLFEESLGKLEVEPKSDSWSIIAKGLNSSSVSINRNRTLLRWVSITSAMIAIAVYLFIRSCSVSGESRCYKVFDRYTLLNQKNEFYLVSTSNEFIGEAIQSDNNQIKTNQKKSFKTNSIIQNTKLNNQIKNNSISNVNSAEKTETVLPIFTEKKIEESNSNLITAFNSDITKDKSNENEKSITDIEIKPNDGENLYEMTVNELSNTPNPNIIIHENDSSTVNISLLTSAPPAPRVSTGLILEFGAGPATITNNIKSYINYENSNFQLLNERKITSYDIFINLKYSISDFYVKSGLQYSEFGHNTNLTTTTELHDTSGGYASWILNRFWTYDTIGFYDDPSNPGLTYAILLPTYHIDTTGSQWNSRDELYYQYNQALVKNRYRYIEIPLMIGYQKFIKRIGIFAGGGISYGKMINTTGRYINDNQINNTTFTDNAYKGNNFNLMLNLGVSYALNNNWNIILQSSYKTNLTSIYKPEFDHNYKFQSIGFQLGVCFYIK